MTIPAAKVAVGDGAEISRAFLLGCEADAAEMTKGMRHIGRLTADVV